MLRSCGTPQFHGRVRITVDVDVCRASSRFTQCSPDVARSRARRRESLPILWGRRGIPRSIRLRKRASTVRVGACRSTRDLVTDHKECPMPGAAALMPAWPAAVFLLRSFV